MLTLKKPERSTAQLAALAASGSTGFAREAQRELIRRKAEQLAAELAASKEKGKAQ